MALVFGVSTISLASGCGMTGAKNTARRADPQSTMQNMIDEQKSEWQAEAKRRTVTFNDAATRPESNPSLANRSQSQDPFLAMDSDRDSRTPQDRQQLSATTDNEQAGGRANTGMSRQLADLRDERTQQQRPALRDESTAAGIVQVGRSNRPLAPLVPLESFDAIDQRGTDPVIATHNNVESEGLQQVAFFEPEGELAPAAQADSIAPLPQRNVAIPRDDRPFPNVDSRQTGRPRSQNPLQSISHTLEPRVPQPGEVACPTVLGPYGPEPIDPTVYPDEYLCDGGDRGMPFHYEGVRRGGIDTEDTIGEFKDEQGKEGSTISSKVCIYAPRFAAVRSKSAPVIGEDLSIIAAAHDGVQNAGINTRLGIEEQTQRDALRRLDTSTRPSGVKSEASEGWLGKVDIARGIEERLISYQSLSFIQEGRLQQAEEPILEFGIQAAGEWSREMNPVIVAHEGNGHELKAEFKVRQVTGIEDRRAPGELRIVKLADKEVAKPGDVITFTIRFDNLGGRDLFDITIIDNLTPRLQFIEGSVEAKLPGSVEFEDNGEGSSLLTFKFDEPLKGQTGGSISFKCRVN